MKLINIISVKKITAFSYMAILFCGLVMISSVYNLYKINSFNKSISIGDTSKYYKQSFESRFAVAYWLADAGMFKEATILFNQLLEESDDNQKSAVHYNIGNIFFKRGLIINGANMSVRDEAEYLFRQAKKSYVQSLKAKHNYWDAKHNLDRLLTMLPPDPTPGVGDSDSPGLIMGNIPVGLP